MHHNPLTNALLKPNVAVFLSLCRTRSFTETAKQMGVSQSSVSRTLIELENALSVDLFDHTVHPIRLTTEGALLQQFLLTQLPTFETHLAGLRESMQLKTPLRLGIVESVARTLGRRIVGDLQHQCAPVTVLTGVATYLLKLLDEELLDIIVCSDPFSYRNDLTRRFLFREPSIILAPQNLRLPEPPSWQDLQYCGLPLIHYHKNNSGGKLETKFFARLGIRFLNRIEVDINALLMTFVSQGLGWALTRPSTLTQHPRMAESVRILPMPEPLAARELYVITRQGQFQELACSVTQSAVQGLTDDVIPKILEFAPWTGDYMFVDADGEGTRKPLFKGIESDVYVL